MNNRQLDAWYRHGNGAKLMGEFFAKSNIVAIPHGNTGVQMGGWFRKEIKTVEDLKGLKMRIAGLAGLTLSKLGSVPQQIPGGDIYPALEKGTIDAAEWVGPYDDQKLGFNKVAKFYYYRVGGKAVRRSRFHQQAKFDSLPKEYQAILQAACADAHVDMMAKYDAKNPTALKQLIGAGTQLRQFPKPVMDACYKAAQEVYAETAAKNPEFKKVHDDYRKFMDDQNLWFRVAEVPTRTSCTRSADPSISQRNGRFGARFLCVVRNDWPRQTGQRCVFEPCGGDASPAMGSVGGCGMKGWCCLTSGGDIAAGPETVGWQGNASLGWFPALIEGVPCNAGGTFSGVTFHVVTVRYPDRAAHASTCTGSGIIPRCRQA